MTTECLEKTAKGSVTVQKMAGVIRGLDCAIVTWGGQVLYVTACVPPGSLDHPVSTRVAVRTMDHVTLLAGAADVGMGSTDRTVNSVSSKHF